MPIALQRISFRVGAVALAFALAMLALRAIDTSGPSSTASRADLTAVAGSGLPPGATTDQQIEVLQAQLRSAPDADTYANLGLTYLQKVRESGDSSFYTKADGVLRQSLQLDPATSPRPAASASWRSAATTSAPGSCSASGRGASTPGWRATTA